VYIQVEFTKMVKWNSSTAGSIGEGIANKATEDKISDAEAQAMVIAEVANVLQEQNAEQMKTMMMMFASNNTCYAPRCQSNQDTSPTPHGMPPLQQEARQSQQVLGIGHQQSPQAGELEIHQDPRLTVSGG
jgi:hypothetical protein